MSLLKTGRRSKGGMAANAVRSPILSVATSAKSNKSGWPDAFVMPGRRIFLQQNPSIFSVLLRTENTYVELMTNFQHSQTPHISFMCRIFGFSVYLVLRTSQYQRYVRSRFSHPTKMRESPFAAPRYFSRLLDPPDVPWTTMIT